MPKIDEEEEFFVLVYLYAHTIFSSVTKPNGRHVVPKWILLCLEDGMGWLSQVFGSFNARIAKLKFLFRQSMVFRVMLYEMVNALSFDFHHTVVKVFLTVCSISTVFDFQRTLVLDGSNLLRLQFQCMWFESGEAVAQLNSSTDLDTEIVHQICIGEEVLE